MVVVLVLSATVTAPVRAAEVVFAPGSRIGLAPPAGMTASRSSYGFEDAGRGAIIALTELSAETYSKIEREFSAEQLKSNGFTVDSREDVAGESWSGFIVAARQTVAGTPMRKWALVARASDFTAVVIIVMPQAARDTYPDAMIRAALASFTVRGKRPVEELLGVLPYRIGELAGFRVLQASPGGTAVLTEGPHDTTLPVEQPYVSIAMRLVEIPQPAEQDGFARRTLAPFVNPVTFHVARSQPMRIGGQPGHEIVGDATDSVTGTELVVVQWLRLGAGSYVQMLGFARRDIWDTVFPRMRAIRDGIGPR